MTRRAKGTQRAAEPVIVDLNVERIIEVRGGCVGKGAPTFAVRWAHDAEYHEEIDGPASSPRGYDRLEIEVYHHGEIESGDKSVAFLLEDVSGIRGLATLLAELADRVDRVVGVDELTDAPI